MQKSLRALTSHLGICRCHQTFPWHRLSCETVGVNSTRNILKNVMEQGGWKKSLLSACNLPLQTILPPSMPSNQNDCLSKIYAEYDLLSLAQLQVAVLNCRKFCSPPLCSCDGSSWTQGSVNVWNTQKGNGIIKLKEFCILLCWKKSKSSQMHITLGDSQL